MRPCLQTDQTAFFCLPGWFWEWDGGVSDQSGACGQGRRWVLQMRGAQGEGCHIFERLYICTINSNNPCYVKLSLAAAPCSVRPLVPRVPKRRRRRRRRGQLVSAVNHRGMQLKALLLRFCAHRTYSLQIFRVLVSACDSICFRQSTSSLRC